VDGEGRPRDTQTPSFAPAPLPAAGPVSRPVDPAAEALAEVLAEDIWTGCATAPRSLQQSIGWSQIGLECDRRLLHHLRGTPVVNFPDPLLAVVGTGIHSVLAEYYRRLDAGTGRYLVEQPVLWQGVPGTADLHDRRRRTTVDWKTAPKSKVAHYRSQGPRKAQVVQVMGYGAALAAAGETVDHVALAYVPTDGKLTDLYVWRAPLDVEIAQRAVLRLADVAAQPLPAVPSPGPLCTWCPFYRPHTTDLLVSCPGKDQP
jgi:hypothetical protein